MLTLHTSKLSDRLGLNGKDIVVKSISAAWVKIRELRDTIPADILNRSILEVTADDDTPLGNRIPKRILFELNRKGKIEFLNADRFFIDVEMTGGSVTFFNPTTGESTTCQCVDPKTMCNGGPNKVTVDTREWNEPKEAFAGGQI